MDASRGSQCGALSTGPLRTAAFERAVSGTRHHALLTSNEPPEDSETIFIHSVISEADARLECLDDGISRLQERLGKREEEHAANEGSEIVASVVSKTDGHSACPSLEDEISKLPAKLEQLEKERPSLVTYRTWNRAVLSPLRRLPPEVLAEMFSWTLPTISDKLDLEWSDITQCPWVLTHVSSRWREVAISTSSLWSRLVFGYSETPDPSFEYSLSLAKAQIQRARKLQIYFYGCETTDPGPQVQMFRLLSQHSSRWEDLSIGLTSEIVPLLKSLRGQLPLLKRLWMQWDGPKSQEAVWSIDCFRSTPSLVDFGVFNEARFIPVVLPAHQLTHYDLNGPWDRHMDILRLASNLEAACVEIDFVDESWQPESDETVDLLLLRHLYVSDWRILAYLKTPALVGLALQVEIDNAVYDILHLESFLDRSACPLRRLSFSGFPDPHKTTKILERLPTVTELALVIDDCAASERIDLLMSTLTPGSQVPGRTVVAPQLRSLLFGCESDSYIDYTAYLEMLESRWGAEDCALDTAMLAIEDGPRPQAATLHGLHALRQQGLDLSLPTGEEVSFEVDCWEYRTTWMQ